jgi:hypothetical protein
MTTHNLLAEQVGLLIIANCEQAQLINQLQAELAKQKTELVIPGYETDQEGQGPPPHLR